MKVLDKIKGLINSKKVIYSSSICSDCQMAEKFFKENNIDIKVKKIDKSEYRNELEKKYGKVLVPTIILGNEKFIGFEDNKDKIIKKLGL